MPRPTLLLLSVLVLALSASLATCPAQAQQGRTERAAVTEFQKAYALRTGASIAEMQGAVALLDGFDGKRVAQALVEAYALIAERLLEADDQRLADTNELEELVASLQARGGGPGQLRGDTHEIERLKELRQRTASSRAGVDELRELLATLGARIARIEHEAALSWLLARVVGDRRFDLGLKMAVAQAAGGAGPDILAAIIASLGRARETGALLALIESAGMHGTAAKPAAPQLIALLEDRRIEVRERAALALAQIAVADAIPPMIDLLARSTGQSKRRVATALEVLTREQLGDAPESWRSWWEAEGAAVLAGDRALGGGTPSVTSSTNEKLYYFGIPQDGRAILYIIDCSGSMTEPVDYDTGVTRGGGGEVTRLEACKAELVQALGRLTSEKAFNILWYSDLPHLYRPEMTPVAGDAVRSAQTWVRELVAAGSTNIHDALQLGFSLIGRGARDKSYEVELDTIFLLTDGAPTTLDGKLDSTEKIIAAVRTWNPLERVTIHTIGIGDGVNVPFLEQLAKENGGRFEHMIKGRAPAVRGGGR